MEKNNILKGISPEIIEKYGLGDDNWELTQYTFGNSSFVPYTFRPFNPQDANIFDYPTQYSSVPMAYVSGSSNYNTDVRDFMNNPALVSKILIYSTNPTNFNQTFFQRNKDANGNEFSTPQTPSLSVGTMQFQAGIGMLKFTNRSLILNINQWFEGLVIQPLSDLTMLLLYQQISKSDLLSIYPSGGINPKDDYVSQINPVEKNSLEDLTRRMMPLNSSAYQAVKPFNVYEFNQALIEKSKDGVKYVVDTDNDNF